jgi:hypothetical protein
MSPRRRSGFVALAPLMVGVSLASRRAGGRAGVAVFRLTGVARARLGAWAVGHDDAAGARGRISRLHATKPCTPRTMGDWLGRGAARGVGMTVVGVGVGRGICAQDLKHLLRGTVWGPIGSRRLAWGQTVTEGGRAAGRFRRSRATKPCTPRMVGEGACRGRGACVQDLMHLWAVWEPTGDGWPARGPAETAEMRHAAGRFRRSRATKPCTPRMVGGGAAEMRLGDGHYDCQATRKTGPVSTSKTDPV